MARREFDTDAPYQALAFALGKHHGIVPAEGRILLLHPRAHSLLSAFPPERSDVLTPEALDCERLGKRGYTILKSLPDEPPRYALAAVFPGESKDEALRLLALGAAHTLPGSTVLATMSNDLGASRFESKLEELLGTVESQSKNKCRVFWGAAGSASPDLISAWVRGGEPRKIEGVDLWSVPGLFSWNKVDKGSAALASHIPESLSGQGADLGSGYGFLAKAALERCPAIGSITLFDSDSRAIEMSKRNLGEGGKARHEWRDIQSNMPEGRFDFVLMNPPFHEYGRLNVELGKRFFRTAHAILKPGGTLYAVVNRHLPYDETVWEIFPSIEEIADQGGYRVFRAARQ